MLLLSRLKFHADNKHKVRLVGKSETYDFTGYIVKFDYSGLMFTETHPSFKRNKMKEVFIPLDTIALVLVSPSDNPDHNEEGIYCGSDEEGDDA